MLAAQILTESQQLPTWTDVPAELRRVPSSPLDNWAIQFPSSGAALDDIEISIFNTLQRKFATAAPASKLAFLKRKKFSADGREARITTALAAIDAPQPTLLSPEAWRDVVQEIEEEDS